MGCLKLTYSAEKDAPNWKVWTAESGEKQHKEVGDHWSDGGQYDDWSGQGGSATYRAGLANGYVDNGMGMLYKTDRNGNTVMLGTDGRNYAWSERGGEEISREEWIRRGGDPEKLDVEKLYKFYTGEWVAGIQNKVLIPADFKKNNFGEMLLYNLREVYSDYRSDGSSDRGRYELRDIFKINSLRKDIGSADHATFEIAGSKVSIIVVIKEDINGKYLTSGENQFSGLKPKFSHIKYSNRFVFSMKIDGITFSITTPVNQDAVNAAQAHLNNMARFIYNLPTPGFNLSLSNPYGN